jgi:hypothetical protein
MLGAGAVLGGALAGIGPAEPARALASGDDGEIADLIENSSSATRAALDANFVARAVGAIGEGLDARDFPSLWALSGTSTAAHGEILAFMSEAVTRGFSKVVLTGSYQTRAEVVVPDGIREIEIPGGSTWTVVEGAGIRKSGSISLRSGTGTMTALARSFTVSDPGAYTEGEWILVGGANAYPDEPTNFWGWIRQVRKVDGTTISVDRAFPRTIDLDPQVFAMSMAASLRVSGRGRLIGTGANAPSGAQIGLPLIRLEAMENPEIIDLELGEYSTQAIAIYNTVNGRASGTYIHDLYGGTTGYGINLGGGTRNFSVDRTTRIERCRHAVTTNVGPPLSTGRATGEPEDNYIGPIAGHCENKTLDSHRAGWGNVYDCHIFGGGGGVTVRADNTTVIGHISNVAGTAVSVFAGVTSPAIIDVTISGAAVTSDDDASGILARGRAIVKNAVINNTSGGWAMVLASNVIVQNSHIEGSERGIRFTGQNTDVRATFGADVTTAFEEASAPEVSEVADLNNRLNLPDREIRGAWPDSTAIYVTAAGTAVNTAVVGPGTLWSLPIDVPEGSISALVVSVTTPAVGATARLGIYSSKPDGSINRLITPDNLIADLGVLGNRTAAIPNGFSTVGGRYWLACMVEGGSPTLRTTSSPGTQYSINLGNQLNSLIGDFQQRPVQAGSSLPTEFPRGNGSAVSVRIAAAMAV